MKMLVNYFTVGNIKEHRSHEQERVTSAGGYPYLGISRRPDDLQEAIYGQVCLLDVVNMLKNGRTADGSEVMTK